MKMKRFAAHAIFLVACCFSAFAATTIDVALVPSYQGSAHALRLTCSSFVKFHVFTLSNPERLVIDLEGIHGKAEVKQHLNGHPLIKNSRHGYPIPHTVRLVYDLSQPVRIAATKTTDKGQRRVQLQVLFSPISRSTFRAKKTVKPALREIVVVIDPGHGGHDPGAKGPHHALEKDIVLAIAKSLKHLIEKQPGMRVVLTRDEDRYVGLRKRLQFAHQSNADVFISIHADAYSRETIHGASVFALSQRGATSEAARWLAEKENYSELGGVDLRSLDDRDGMVRVVLLDLAQTATISSSLKLGAVVLKNLDSVGSLHHSTVEQARFVVLKSPDTPSILVETGFISNPTDARNLINPTHQMKLAQAIFTGLKRYFSINPPHGTRFEALSLSQGKMR